MLFVRRVVTATLSRRGGGRVAASVSPVWSGSVCWLLLMSLCGWTCLAFVCVCRPGSSKARVTPLDQDVTALYLTVDPRQLSPGHQCVLSPLDKQAAASLQHLGFRTDSSDSEADEPTPARVSDGGPWVAVNDAAVIARVRGLLVRVTFVCLSPFVFLCFLFPHPFVCFRLWE